MLEMIEDGSAYSFEYVNHRGEKAIRRVRFEGLRLGVHPPYYPEPTLLFCGWDLDKDAARDFAFNKINAATFTRIGDAAGLYV